MPVSGTSGVDGNYLNLANQLESYIKDEGKDKWTAATLQIGNFASNAEADLIAAFSTPDNPEQLKNLAIKLGLSPEQAAKADAEAVQTVAKSRYERAQRMMAALSNILDSMHQAMMRVINNIRS